VELVAQVNGRPIDGATSRRRGGKVTKFVARLGRPALGDDGRGNGSWCRTQSDSFCLPEPRMEWVGPGIRIAFT
jgi:hypothetical protein